MFTKRLCALLLALVLSIGVMLPAQARVVEYNLDEAIEALKGYLEGYTDYSIDSIVSWIQRCEGRWSRELEEYAVCLQEIEAENFVNIRGRIYDLNTERFRAFLEEKELSSLADIQTYADARQAECDGDIERAILLYEATEVCDSSSRRYSLQRSLKQDKYDEAMAGYNSNTYEGAKLAAELFAELAQSYYSNSADMARQAEAKREELRSISVTVNESLNGRNFTMAVTADGAWTVSNDASWLELSCTSGNGNATITATMEENRTSDDRTAVLTFRCGNKTETKSIWQEKTDWIVATQSGSTIRVEANGRWTAVEEADWLTLSKTSGSGNGSITLRMEDNVGSSARTADVYFTCGSASTSVSIRQEKKDVLTAAIVGTRINVESNGSWTATDDASWLTLSKTSGYGDATITITAETNTTSSARTATITLKCGSEKKTLTFRQEKTDHITVSVSGSGNTRTINVTANGSWTVAENSNWLTLSRTSGSGNASITATLEPNTTSTAREAIMTFTCGSDTERVTIEQQKVDTLNVSISGSGNARTITVTSNGSWTATENAAWLTLSKTSGTGNATVTATLQANSGSARSATIIFKCGSVTKKVNIEQAEAYTIDAKVSGNGDTRTITVTANGSWTASENASWLTLSKTSGSGNATLTVTMQPNTGTSRRVAAVTFTCGSAKKTVNITQQKTDTLSVSTSGSGDTRTITVISNGGWVASEDASWLTLSKTSGSGNATLSVNMSANTTNSNRTATITFRCGSVTKAINITQQKTDTLSVSTSGSGDTRTIKVTCNGSWTATENASWLTLSKTSGSGNATLSVNMSANTTNSNRTATITFKCGNVQKSINITQQKTDTLSVSISGSGNTRSIKVTCNGSWTATENYSWLSLGKTSGNGNATVSVNLATNNTSSRRTATITFKCGSVTKSVNITQEVQRTFEITGATKGSDGTVTVRWTDTANNGPYSVLYMQRTKSSWSAEMDADTIFWSSASSVSGKSHTISNLVPGYSYWLIVRDSDGMDVAYEYRPGAAPTFSEYGNELQITLKTTASGVTSNVSSYSARDIAANLNKKEYFAYVQLDFSMLARARHYNHVMAICDPRGQTIAVGWGGFDYPSGSHYIYWNKYAFNDYFRNVLSAYGYIPTGTYTMSLYQDGKFATSDTFTVGN